MKLKFYLLDVDYIEQEDKPVIKLFGKTGDGKAIVAFCNYEPYFYVLPVKINKTKKDIKKLLEKYDIKIKRIETVKRKLFGIEKQFLKIFCNLPQDVPKARDVIKQLEIKRGGNFIIDEYEYGINFYKRFLIDSRINGWLEVNGDEIETDYIVDIAVKAKTIKKIEKSDIPKLKILAFDIECFEQAGKQKIIMLSLFGKNSIKVLTYQNNKYQKYVEVVENEKRLIERFVEEVNKYDPDILVSFNGDSYDFPIIQERADEYKINLALSKDKSNLKFRRRARLSSARINGRVHIDIFNFINNILSPHLQTEVLSLDYVSAELLGDKKIKFQYQEILEIWRKKRDLSKLAEYCLKDSELAIKLTNLLLPQIAEISRVVGQLIFDISRMTYGQLVEWYLTRKAVEINEIIPNQPKFEEIQRRRMTTYVGGFVKEPIAGIHESIAVLDFKSLYPSIIATFNISPELLNCKCCKNNGHRIPETNYWFCKNKKGFVSGVIKEIIEMRNETKQNMKKLKHGKEWEQLDRRQYGLKIIANATYGYYAFAGAKWYCKQCAESAAALGRHFIHKIIEETEKTGFTVLYADTDSCFIKSENDFIEKTDVFLNKINKKLPGIMELELQGFYKRGIFIPKGTAPGTAKKRYALIDEKNNLVVRGLETVRRDWCNLAKELQRNVLVFILKNNDIDAAVKYVKDTIKKIRNKEILLKDLVIYEQLTKPLSDYKQIGPHVVAARKIKERGRPVGAGMVVMFVITKGKGSISQRAEPIEDVTIDKIDENYYINNQIVPAALRVLQVLGVRHEQLLDSGLEKFLG